ASQLEPSQLAGLNRLMETQLAGRDAEQIRRILGYRAARAQTATEIASLIELLERSLRHPSSRVRLHAHRLLRVHAERPRYLAATRPMLDDSDPVTVRSAIRALSFGG